MTNFELLADSDAEPTYRLLSRLHPQLATLILSKMPAGKAAKLMDMMDPDLHNEIIVRMADLERVDQRVIAFLDTQLARYVRRYDYPIEGLSHIGDILNKSENLKLVNDSLKCLERDDIEIQQKVLESMRRMA